MRVFQRAAVGLVQKASSPVSAGQRRFASAQFAHMKVKKNNWVEQNEVLRENKFYGWSINRSNIIGLACMTVIFPLGYHYLHASEQAVRDQKMRKIAPRETL